MKKLAFLALLTSCTSVDLPDESGCPTPFKVGGTVTKEMRKYHPSHPVALFFNMHLKQQKALEEYHIKGYHNQY